MARTASRPLPSGRVTSRQVAAFAALGSLAGIGYLAVLEPPIVTLLAALSWSIYVLIYTPLKHASVWHLAVGAVVGAMPVMLGAATANAVFAPLSLALVGIVFFWQFSHTAAIGWIYREQYACAVKVAAVVIRWAGWLPATLGAAAAAGKPGSSNAIDGRLAVVAVALPLDWLIWPLPQCFSADPRRRCPHCGEYRWLTNTIDVPLVGRQPFLR